ncbi:hypothetical protein U2I54_27595 [Bacillus pseudomycoides]|uniref:Uncharacterized protein n=1 Tax=Bacillus bingmayongensis TaxID=1150157 RepID=A0ABU5K4J9_9BACI|nr:hypothetical protein [Bacillus pseudomycoides]
MATLLEECIEALGEDIHILTGEQGEKVLNQFESTFPITLWGRIDWSNINKYGDIYDTSEIELYLHNCLDQYSNKVYIIWDEATLPIIETHLHKVLQVIDDVTAVSFDTWIYSPDVGYVIEYYHEGDIRIGNVTDVVK